MGVTGAPVSFGQPVFPIFKAILEQCEKPGDWMYPQPCHQPWLDNPLSTMGKSNEYGKINENHVPSGNWTVRYWKWPSRNSGFTWIYPLKFLHIFFVCLPEDEWKLQWESHRTSHGDVPTVHGWPVHGSTSDSEKQNDIWFQMISEYSHIFTIQYVLYIVFRKKMWSMRQWVLGPHYHENP